MYPIDSDTQELEVQELCTDTKAIIPHFVER